MTLLSRFSFIILLLIGGKVLAEVSDSAVQKTDLQNRYQAIRHGKVNLLQGQPIIIHSDLKDTRLTADVYAIAPYKFKDMAERLSQPDQWCRFITLHLNIKACLYQLTPEKVLQFFVGRKFFEPVEDAYQINYRFNLQEKTDEYFKLILSAAEGPFGTSDYQILYELQKIESQVIMHMSLSYQTSFRSRVGSSVYLSTIGADKVGFSQTKTEDGESEFIGGVEGIIERNVMRYFLALDVYFRNQNTNISLPEAWFDATENYSRQLHEVEKADYLEAKVKEFRQQTSLQNNLGADQISISPTEDQ